MKNYSRFSFRLLLPGALLLAVLITPRLFAQGSIASPSAFTSERLFYVGLQSGAGTNSFTGDTNDVLSIPASTTTNITSPVWALYKGRGFSFTPQTITSATGTTNTVTFFFNLAHTNKLNGTQITTTTAPLSYSYAINSAGILVGFTNFPSSVVDNAGLATLTAISNGSPNIIIVSNLAVGIFP